MADDAGPLLARAGLIANEQLLQARQAQASHGGTLGEHLVLAGFIEDEELTSFYRSRLMVPRIDPRQLQNIPARVIARIPKDMAAEFRLVPIAIDREQNLILAMSDPSNTHAVDEIGFFTGAYVVRTVANQREIAEALDRYYGIHTPLLAAPARQPPQPQTHLDAASERRNVLPPMSAPPAGSGRAVRISEIVPALREAKASEARAQASGRVPAQRPPAVASPDARTAVPGDHFAPEPPPVHERRTQQAPQRPRYDPEDDTRPIARMADLLPPERTSREESIAMAGEISAPDPDPHQSEKLEAVIVADDLSPPTDPPVLLTRKRPSAELAPPAAPAATDRPVGEDVVLLSRRKTVRGRSPAVTRQGIGELGADVSKLPNVRLGNDDRARSTAVATADASAQTQEMKAIQGEPPAPSAPAKAEMREARTAHIARVSVEVPDDVGPVAAVPDDDRTGRFERPQQVAEIDDGWGEPGSTIPPQFLGAYDDEPSSPLGFPVPDIDDIAVPNAASPSAATQNAVSSSAVYDASVRRLAAAMKTLAAAAARDEVLSTLVAYMAASCRRAAFFAVTKGSLRGWSAVGEGVATENLDHAELALDRPSTFQDIVATRLPFHGPVHDEVSRDFLRAAVGAPPSDMTALPVCIRGKVIGIAYGDERKLQIVDEHLNSLVRCAGEALERIVMTRKTTTPGR